MIYDTVCFFVVPWSCRQEESVKPVKPVVLSNIRNDSDIHLDGVLLDGVEGSHASLEGSNWSLNSCGSSQSNKSQDNNPPCYFQVAHDSWEECNGQHLMMNNEQRIRTTSQLHNAQGQSLNHQSPATLPLSSLYNSQPQHHSNGTNGQIHSPACFKNSIAHNVSPNQQISKSSSSSNGSATSSSILSKGTPKTMPVAVPNRNFHQNRTESNSSASIGRWVCLFNISIFNLFSMNDKWRI